jgi:hypothetical protein
MRRCSRPLVYCFLYCFLAVMTTVAEDAQSASPLQGAIPDALPDALAQLRVHNSEIKKLMDRGEFGSIYVPALQAMELALALEAHRSELGPGAEKLLDAAQNRVVRYAYLLDVVGDLGNRDLVVAAYAQFEAAERDIEAAFMKKPGEPR